MKTWQCPDHWDRSSRDTELARPARFQSRVPTLPMLFAVAAALAWHAAAGAAGAVVTTEQVRAELLAHAPQGVAPGKPVWLGLSIEHLPHWHTYWKNPGDSGLPTTLTWQLPSGVTAGEIDWPTPVRIPVGPLVNYGYEGKLLLPVPLTVPSGFNASTLDVKLHAQWLVCKDVCIPQTGEFTLALPAQATTAAHAARFDTALAQRPPADPKVRAAARLDAHSLVLSVDGLAPALHSKPLQFFPETAGVIENAAQPAQQWNKAAWQTRVPLSAQRSESPRRMHAVLVSPERPSGVRIGFEIEGAWPAPGAAAVALAPEATAGTSREPRGAAIGLGLALGLAFIGGLLLNLMPCVFPVLSLKVLGFAAHAHQRRALLGSGLAYTAGVVLSFVALAAVMLALRAGGEQLGWGFQLQSPGFVAALAVLFTLIGLNLAGSFEVGGLLPGRLLTLRARHPLADSALTGVLAVAVASPCTAPFMGASLGTAVTLPTGEALAVFAALGFGMAAPYLAASAWPRLARALPRPGPWMVRFKAVMAFPMFATVVWLLWVLGQQTGIDGAAALLAVLVALAFAAWVLGESRRMRGAARAGFGVAALLALSGTLAWVLPTLREAPPGEIARATEGGWQTWSPQRVAELNAQGRPVFVDFTAAWCVTCQINKRMVLSDPQLLADLALHKVALLRADWTRRDPMITAELARLGRSGVPVYALYRNGASQPHLFGEMLRAQDVRSAISSLTAAR